MAGFEQSDGYWLPRDRLTVPPSLAQKIWPWLEQKEEWVSSDLTDAEKEQNTSARKKHPTAYCFLHFLRFLRDVLIQDVAAIMSILEHPDPTDSQESEIRLTHILFTDFPIFQDPEFLAYKDEMHKLLSKLNETSQDPKIRAIDQCLPGVNQRFEHLNVEHEILKEHMYQIFFEIDNVKESMTKSTEAIINHLKQMEIRMNMETDRKIMRFSEAISSSFQSRIGTTVEAISEATQHAARITFSTNENEGNDVTDTDPTNEISSPARQPVPPPPPSPQDAFAAAFPPPSPQQDAFAAAFPCTLPSPNTVHPSPESDTPTNDPPNVSPNNPSPSEDNIENFLGMKLPCTHVARHRLTMKRLYFEFFGLGERQDQPVKLGFHGLDLKFQFHWRKPYQQSDKTLYSRVQTIVRGIATHHGVEFGSWSDDIEAFCLKWDPFLQRKGVAGVFRQFQKDGITTKRGNRSPNTPPPSTQNNTPTIHPRVTPAST